MSKKLNKILLIIFSVFSIGAVGFFLTKKQETIVKENGIEIKTFDRARDEQFLRDSFAKDYYWLVENPNFSLDFLIEHISPNKDPEYFGKLNIKILYLKDKPIGFTTYFKKKFYEGKIQFVYVHPDYRGKGYAKELTKYALKDLFKQGALIVKLDTRTTNIPAIKIYQGLGFKETFRDEKRGIVSFSMAKDDYK